MPVVGLLSLELHLPSARSLKDKRMVLRSVKDRLHKLNLAVAEIGHLELRQRSRLAIVAVGLEQGVVERLLEKAVDEAERKDAGIVVATDLEWLT